MKYKVNPLIKDCYNYTEAILKARGVEDINSFLSFSYDNIQSPYDLDGMEECAKWLYLGINGNAKMAILVDCDVDGFTSSAILINYIKERNPSIQIDHYLHEGKQHGLEDTWEEMAQKNYDLIIVPDAGSQDGEFIEHLQIPVIVLDHHEIAADAYFPKNCFLSNNQASPNYRNKALSGAGMAYQCCRVLDDFYSTPGAADRFLDLAALGICADVMSGLSIENQAIWHKGFSDIQNYGLYYFIKHQAFSMKGKVNPTSIAWYIAPLINAVVRAGTMEEKELIFRAFIDGNNVEPSTKRGHKPGDTEITGEKAARVASNCRNRQNKTLDVGEKLIIQKITDEQLDAYPIILVSLDEKEARQIPQELTGLVAMKICATYGKPTLIGRGAEEGEVRGSIRNTAHSPIESLKDFLEESGYFTMLAGHGNAAGFTIPTENIAPFLEYSKEKLKDVQLNENTYLVDYVFSQNRLNDIPVLAEELAKLENVWSSQVEEPYIALTNISITNDDVTLMGAQKDSTKIVLNNIAIVKFKDADFAAEVSHNSSSELNLVGRVQINEYNGYRNYQFIIEDYDIRNNKYDF